LAGCSGTNDDTAIPTDEPTVTPTAAVEDDFDPELATIVVENLNEVPHTVTIELYQGIDANESVVTRMREMGTTASGGSGPTEWRISDFPGMGTDFTIKVRVDDGDQHTFQTTINGCTRFRVEIQDTATVNISEEGKTICYQG
jgi:hypothetical protein